MYTDVYLQINISKYMYMHLDIPLSKFKSYSIIKKPMATP